jgi:cobalt-zinc-cadmium efflux system membrane fusion protein
MNRVSLSVVVVAAAATFMAGCGSKTEAARNPTSPPAPVASASAPQLVVLAEGSPQLEQIHVDTVHEHSFAVDEVVAPGRIELNPNRVSRLMLPVAGRITDVMAHTGDTVTQGQPVLLLESSDADAALASAVQAEGALTQAKAAQTKAKGDYDRLAELLAQDAVAKKDVLAAQTSLSQAEAAVLQAEAGCRQSKARIALLGIKTNQPRQRIEVAAPISGKILEMSTVAGEFRNDTSTPVMTIADLSSVWISSDVPESQIRQIHTGEFLQVELTAYPDVAYQAKVTRIADMVDPVARTVKVYAELPNPGCRFKPEMFGRVRHVNQTRSLAAVPPGAVIESAGASYVFREVQPGTFEQEPIVIAGRTKDYVGISSGLRHGARVVVDGAMLLKAY